MPLHTYNTQEQHLRQSVSALDPTDRLKHSHTPVATNPPHVHQHALIAAHKAMSRYQPTTTRRLDRAHSRGNIRSSHSTPLGPTSIRIREQRDPVVTQRSPPDKAKSDHPQHQTKTPIKYERYLTPSEFGFVGNVHDPQPSSYQRLRKAKSLMSTRSSGGGTAASVKDAKYARHTQSLRKASSVMSLSTSSVKLRLRRSLQMLRSHKHREERPINYQPELTCRPESIALARSEFFQISTPVNATSRRSQAPICIPRDSPKTLPKSVRSPEKSTQKSETLATDENRLMKTKRSISASVKKRLRRVFGRPASAHGLLPPQQVDALKHHFVENPARSHSENAFDSYCDDDPELSRRKSFFITPEGADDNEESTGMEEPGNIRLIKYPSSVRSSPQSRLTSWANSSTSGSIRNEICRLKRLSVIREDGGPHQPSSSAGRHVGGLALFQQPLQLSQGTQINSQRIYSALLKRIDQEQVEMVQTEAALREIHAAQNEALDSSHSHATIRRVHSADPFARSETYERRNFSCRDPSSPRKHQAETPIVLQNSKAKRDQRQIEQSTTFSGSTSGTDSHTQRSFREIRSRQRQRHGSHASVSHYDNARPSPPTDNRAHAESPESIYSRTTNGGNNVDYISLPGSSEELSKHNVPYTQSQGVATILVSNHMGLAQSIDNRSRFVSMSESEKVQWKGWLEHQMADFTGSNPPNDGHVREGAQIDPYEPELDQTVFKKSSFDGVDPHKIYRSGSAHIRTQHEQVRPVPYAFMLSKAAIRSENSIVPVVNVEHEQVEKMATNDISTLAKGVVRDDNENHEPDRHKPRVVRKLSATHMANVLRLRKSQPSFHLRTDVRKENKPILGSHLFAGKNSEDSDTFTGAGLRESSINNMRAHDIVKKGSPSGHSLNSNNQSPSFQTKTALSARLSRPFDMDVPEYNRPFDSMFLGKIDRPTSENSRNARLSVASNARPLRATKSYGGLGLPRLEATSRPSKTAVDLETTALPRIPDEGSETRATSLSNIASGSKRMVSNFLRSRRKETKAPDVSPGPDFVSSPVFI